MRIVLAGGGSGGHLFPLVAVLRRLREKTNNTLEVIYIGPVGAMEKEAFSGEDVVIKRIASGKIRRYFSLLNFSDPFFVFFGFVQSLWYLLFYMPDVVFSKGGFGSVPVVLVAWLYRIPVFVHESDAMPGIANRILGKFATTIALSYPSAKQFFLASKVTLTGNPVRRVTSTGNPQRARDYFAITGSQPVIFITGGSQGSEIINTAILKILPELLKIAIVVHQVGVKNLENTKLRAQEYNIDFESGNYKIVDFMSAELMGDVLALSSLVISRAGATSIAQIAAHKKPVILIPLLSAANDHQRINAYEIGKIGGAVILSEKNLGGHILMDKITSILHDKNLALEMGEKISVFYHADAADKIADGLLLLARVYES